MKGLKSKIHTALSISRISYMENNCCIDKIVVLVTLLTKCKKVVFVKYTPALTWPTTRGWSQIRA